MDKKIIFNLYADNLEVKKTAIYQIMFDRLFYLLPELKRAASFEKNQEIATLMAQVHIKLSTYSQDLKLEKQILDLISTEHGINKISKKMLDYLQKNASSKIQIAVLGAMHTTVPSQAIEFVDFSLNHPDPFVRIVAAQVAINSGRPTHFAYLLSLIADSDLLVSKKAFQIIKDLPPNELAILIDCSLGSGDTWILKTVSIFLPLLVNESLRHVLSKHVHHTEPFTKEKINEALKKLDASLLSKFSNKTKEYEKSERLIPSFREQLKFKQLQKEEQKTTQYPTGEPENSDTLGNTELIATDEDMQNFAEELSSFESLFLNTNISETKPVDPLFSAPLTPKGDISLEQQKILLESIDDSTYTEELPPITLPQEITPKIVKIEMQPQPIESIKAIEAIENSETSESSETIETSKTSEPIEFVESVEQPPRETNTAVVDLPPHPCEILLQDKAEQQADKVEKTKAESPKIEKSTQTSKPAISLADFDLYTAAENLLGTDNKVETPKPPVPQPDTSPAKAKIKQATNKKNLTVPKVKTKKEPAQKQQPTVPKPPLIQLKNDCQATLSQPIVQETKKITEEPLQAPTASKISPLANVIIRQYPSFVSVPFSEVFKNEQQKIKRNYLIRTIDSFIAFLNMCFMQSCLYYLPTSKQLLDMSNECIKHNLIGITSMRALYYFADSLSIIDNNKSFFTFLFAKKIVEVASDNPLIMIRELYNFLINSKEQSAETIEEAVEALTAILIDSQLILYNSIVMKTAKTAKEPFADLSKPKAAVLSHQQRPLIELPENEAVLISKERTEGLGLFPYFKYSKLKIGYSTPTADEIQVLKNRLEL